MSTLGVAAMREALRPLGKEHAWVGVEITLDADVPAYFADYDGKTMLHSGMSYEVTRFEGTGFVLRSTQTDPAQRQTRPGGEKYYVDKVHMKHFKPIRGTVPESRVWNYAGANRVLEDILVIVGAPPAVTSPEALAILTRVTEGWAEGEEIDLHSGLGWMRFQQRIGVQKDLYMNERQIRRELRELVDAGLLQGDPNRAIWWTDADGDDDEDDED